MSTQSTKDLEGGGTTTWPNSSPTGISPEPARYRPATTSCRFNASNLPSRRSARAELGDSGTCTCARTSTDKMGLGLVLRLPVRCRGKSRGIGDGAGASSHALRDVRDSGVGVDMSGRAPLSPRRARGDPVGEKGTTSPRLACGEAPGDAVPSPSSVTSSNVSSPARVPFVASTSGTDGMCCLISSTNTGGARTAALCTCTARIIEYFAHTNARMCSSAVVCNCTSGCFSRTAPRSTSDSENKSQNVTLCAVVSRSWCNRTDTCSEREGRHTCVCVCVYVCPCERVPVSVQRESEVPRQSTTLRTPRPR